LSNLAFFFEKPNEGCFNEGFKKKKMDHAVILASF
jgi:hypothetical protein